MNRKDLIINVAISLFAQKGFTETPTSAIAKEAGVSEGLIFHYFNSKKEILLHILTQISDSYLFGSRKRIQDTCTGLEAIEELIRFHFEFKKENSEALLVLIRDVPFPLLKSGENSQKIIKQKLEGILGQLSECIERGKQDGSIRDFPTWETTLLIQEMLNGISRMHLLGPIEVPNLTSQVISFCRQALGTQAFRG